MARPSWWCGGRPAHTSNPIPIGRTSALSLDAGAKAGIALLEAVEDGSINHSLNAEGINKTKSQEQETDLVSTGDVGDLGLRVEG